jgi:hypothetical protein
MFVSVRVCAYRSASVCMCPCVQCLCFHPRTCSRARACVVPCACESVTASVCGYGCASVRGRVSVSLYACVRLKLCVWISVWVCVGVRESADEQVHTASYSPSAFLVRTTFRCGGDGAHVQPSKRYGPFPAKRPYGALFGHGMRLASQHSAHLPRMRGRAQPHARASSF